MNSSKVVPDFLAAFACALVLALTTSGDARMNMRCRVVVPKEYRSTPLKPPPDGESEPARYTVAYEAFWWNCVAVRAADLRGRCPFIASGTPAASAGARDGASNADSQIERLLKTHVSAEVQRYLRSIASASKAKEKMRPYFDGPTPEAAN
jgi:hypothetical protein